MRRSSYIVYVDESGDHGLDNINPTAPIFVLCAALYRTPDYISNDLLKLTEIKFRLWNHDSVVFHSRSIRRRLPPFEAAKDPVKRALLMGEIAKFFRDSKVILIAAALNKPALKAAYQHPENPYFLALQFVLERVYGHIRENLEDGQQVVFIFESRGANEDIILSGWFDRVIAGDNQWSCALPFRAEFASKQANMPGLQIADLAAYPTAKHVEHPGVSNLSWDAIEPRFRRSPQGVLAGWGLKVFP